MTGPGLGPGPGFGPVPLSPRIRRAVLILGLTFVAGASAALIAYVADARLDGLAVFGFVLVALLLLLLMTGAPSRTPRRWSVLRLLVGFIGIFSFAIFPILGFMAAGSDDAYGLMFVAGLLLTAAAVCVTTLGRPGRGRRVNDGGLHPREPRPR